VAAESLAAESSASARESALAAHLDPGLGDSPAPPVPVLPGQAGPSEQARRTGPLPALIVDETDDAGGHRIYYDPWAADRDD